MKITAINIQNSYEDWRYQYRIEIDGKGVCSFGDGEAEDNSLSRNFNDVYRIPKLLKMAYDAGKKNEEFEIETKSISSDEDEGD